MTDPVPPAARFKLLSARRDRTAAMPFIMATALLLAVSHFRSERQARAAAA